MFTCEGINPYEQNGKCTFKEIPYTGGREFPSFCHHWREDKCFKGIQW